MCSARTHVRYYPIATAKADFGKPSVCFTP